MIRQTFNNININIMKALIIIAAMLVLVVVLKVLDALTFGVFVNTSIPSSTG